MRWGCALACALCHGGLQPLGVPRMETAITRHLTICLFIEDGTIAMNEGAPQNGMSGGCFANRAIYQKEDGTEYTAKDLSIGNTIHVRGQDVLIYDADKNTREYFRKNSCEISSEYSSKDSSEYAI